MFRLDVDMDLRALDRLERSVDRVVRSPNFLLTFVSKRMRGLSARLLRELQTEPGSPRYPLRWKSAKQRKAYFASDGFGHGIPYKRTHRFAEGWSINVHPTRDGGQISADNPTAARRYITGPDQQPFHTDTGWYREAQVLARYRLEAQDVVFESFLEATDPDRG